MEQEVGGSSPPSCTNYSISFSVLCDALARNHYAASSADPMRTLRDKFSLSPKWLPVRKRETNRRDIIAPEDVPARFDDACIGQLATYLPQVRDLSVFGWWMREAACMFAQEARIPTANQLNAEIGALYEAARRQLFGKVVDLRDKLSHEAREMLPGLPASSDLRSETLREEACHAVERLCRIRGEKGRRPSAKQSPPTIRAHLYAPKPSRNFPKRGAELQFVARLSTAWRDACGKEPSFAARHPDASRDLGPFGRFVRKCLSLVGATYADPVELLNQLHRGPRVRKSRPAKV